MPSAFATRGLNEAGLGERKLSISSTASPEEVKDGIVTMFPKLKDAGGFEYLKGCGGSKTLEPIPLPPEGFCAAALRSTARQSRIYIRPVQNNLDMTPVTVSYDDL